MNLEKYLKNRVDYKKIIHERIEYLQKEIKEISKDYALSLKSPKITNVKVDVSFGQNDLLEILEKVDKNKTKLLQTYYEELAELNSELYIISLIEFEITNFSILEKDIIKYFYEQGKLVSEIIDILKISERTFFRTKKDIINRINLALKKIKKEMI